MKQSIFILLVGIAAISCQKSDGKSEVPTEQSKAFDNRRAAFFDNIMAPAEVAAQIQFTAADFAPKLMNDPEKFSMYAGNEVKAAGNLGIYLSDLNYCIAYEQSGGTTKKYFQASHELSKAIGIEKNVLAFLAKRYDQNISRNDSLKNVVTDLLQQSTLELQETSKEKLAGIAMSAYQIENLHLALGILNAYPKDMLPDDARATIMVPLIKVVVNQRANIENIYNFLQSYSDPLDPDKNPNYPFYTNAFKELLAVYKKLDVEEKIANNKGLEIINDAQVRELSEKVNAIRDKVVSVD